MSPIAEAASRCRRLVPQNDDGASGYRLLERDLELERRSKRPLHLGFCEGPPAYVQGLFGQSRLLRRRFRGGTRLADRPPTNEDRDDHERDGRKDEAHVAQVSASTPVMMTPRSPAGPADRSGAVRSRAAAEPPLIPGRSTAASDHAVCPSTFGGRRSTIARGMASAAELVSPEDQDCPRSTFIKLSGLALLVWHAHAHQDYVSHHARHDGGRRGSPGPHEQPILSLWTASRLIEPIGIGGATCSLAPAGRPPTLVVVVLVSPCSHRRGCILDPRSRTAIHSPLVYGGWLLSLVSLLVLTVVM